MGVAKMTRNGADIRESVKQISGGTQLEGPRRVGRRPSEQVLTAARTARSLRSLGLSLNEIAGTDVMKRFLGEKTVSEARISQLLRLQTREPPWARDTRAVIDEWCRPPMAPKIGRAHV